MPSQPASLCCAERSSFGAEVASRAAWRRIYPLRFMREGPAARAPRGRAEGPVNEQRTPHLHQVRDQNPMELDYRALSNAGLWWIGRLQTDADRARVMDGLFGATTNGSRSSELEHIVQRLAPRWVIVKNTREAEAEPILHRPRDTWSRMRGPLTRSELRALRIWKSGENELETRQAIAAPEVAEVTEVERDVAE